MGRRGVARLATTLLATAVVASACSMVSSPSPCRGELSDPAEGPTHHDPELEDRLPATVGGEPFDVQSVCANAVDPGGLTMSEEFLDEVGVAIDDVTLALTSPQIGGGMELSLTAFRYRGASDGSIRSAFTEAMRDSGETIERETRAGKDVDVARGPLANGTVAYVADDTLYLLTGVDGDVEELLAALP